MRLGLTIRTLDGASRELTVVDGHFRPAGEHVDLEVDSGGWWAVPGLADCHAHLGGGAGDDNTDPDEVLERTKANAWAQLEGGVFLVADKGHSTDVTLRVLAEPPTTRPELQMAGRMLANPGGYFTGFAIEVDEHELVDAVRGSTGGGATWVKLVGDWPRKGIGAVTNFTEAAMHQAVDVAHAADCRVAIHAAAPETSTLAVAAGIDSIEHGLFITADDLAALGARGGAWVPTIAAMEGVRDMLGAASSGGKLFAEGLDNVRELLASAPGLGVSVLAGSDIEVAHGDIATEALRLGDYGLPAEAVVHATTSAAYEYLAASHSFEPGGHADVLFFDADPRDDLEVLARPALGLRHGEVVVGSV
ncbi:MAG: amidohydrolase family protein [Acidimicrobiia bacterium]|nr:amidohydrolase family protein [Acidimicrobiia bacterium]